VSAVFLFLYIVFAATHMLILKTNKKRAHKFNFSGALFGKIVNPQKQRRTDGIGFCAVRVVTMSLRIAWSKHPRNVRLGIAAQVFVYAGTIILYIVNWFFAQRIVRAQHPRFGWSKPARIVFRAAIACLILSLILLIVGAIQQFFTQNTSTLRIDHDLQLTGQTYFAVLCFAPIAVVIVSLIVPRKGTEKFGAGRLRNNIAILLITSAILSAGQFFRMATAYLPATPLRNAQGLPLNAPWYYSKACFYAFNFTTEFLVIFIYAIVRVDLRFHIPDGSHKPGDYSNSPPKAIPKAGEIGILGNEKNLKRLSKAESIKSNASNETLHQYAHSIFDDTQTLADSLRYPSTVLEIDAKNGSWKIKRASRATSVSSVGTAGPSISNLSQSNVSRHSSAGDSKRRTAVDGTAPPVPHLETAEWPLRESLPPRFQIPVMEHRNRASRRASVSPHGSSKLRNMEAPEVEKGDAIDAAIAKLEANSSARTSKNSTYLRYGNDEDAISPVKRHGNSTGSRSHRYSASGQPSPSSSSQIPELPDSSHGPLNKTSTSSYATAQSELLSRDTDAGVSSPPQSSHCGTMTSAEAEREFARFSYEAPPMQRSLSDTEKELERR
jgi:hypothetical protein